MSEQQRYLRFWRSAVMPWWSVPPQAWQSPNGIGIAHLALKGEVGMFNLARLTLPTGAWERRTDASMYSTAPIRWAILAAPYIFIGGRSLVAHASWKSYTEFQELLAANQQVRPQVEVQGLTWEHLTRPLEKV